MAGRSRISRSMTIPSETSWFPPPAFLSSRAPNPSRRNRTVPDIASVMREHSAFEAPGPAAGLPLVTTVTPCYNQSKYIVETLDSIRNQHYPNVQMLIFDDCSSDDSV